MTHQNINSIITKNTALPTKIALAQFLKRQVKYLSGCLGHEDTFQSQTVIQKRPDLYSSHILVPIQCKKLCNSNSGHRNQGPKDKGLTPLNICSLEKRSKGWLLSHFSAIYVQPGSPSNKITLGNRLALKWIPPQRTHQGTSGTGGDGGSHCWCSPGSRPRGVGLILPFIHVQQAHSRKHFTRRPPSQGRGTQTTAPGAQSNALSNAGGR